MIARRCISSAPVALIAITLKYAQSYLLPVCAVSFALAVHCHGLMVAIGLEKFPSLARCGVSSFNIAKRPVYLAITVKLFVFCITHLANSIMRSILGFWIPVSILSIDESYEASSLCPVNDATMCV
jgi:hypothetical protein